MNVLCPTARHYCNKFRQITRFCDVQCCAFSSVNTESVDAGFTLVELMIAVVIVSTLAVMAIPTLGRGRHDAAFHSDTRRLIHQMHELARKSLTTREDQCLEIDATNSVIIHKMRLPSDPTVVTEVGRWSMSKGTLFVGGAEGAKMPNSDNPFPSATTGLSFVYEQCFTANHEVLWAAYGNDSAWFPGSGTYYISDKRGENKARLIVFGSTGFVKLYDH